MASSIYANDMAKSLFEAALKKGEAVKWLRELRLASDLLKDSALAELIQKKDVPIKDKAREFEKRGNKLSDEMLNLLSMLLEKDKLDLLDPLTVEYQRLLDQHHGIEGSQIAYVTTAIPLDETTRLELGERLTKMAGKPVVIKSKVDPEILGGMIIRLGDKLIDGSVRSKLQTISKELV